MSQVNYLQIPLFNPQLIAKPGVARILPVPINTVVVQPTDDLTNVVNSLKTSNTKLVLMGTEYKVKDMMSINQDGISIVANTRAIIRKLDGGNSPVIFEVLANHFNFENLDFDSTHPATLPNGQNPKIGAVCFIIGGQHGIVRNCTFSNVDTGFNLWPGQWDLYLEDLTSNWNVRGDLMYFGGGDETLERGFVVMNRVKSNDSQQEHGLRCSTPGFHHLVVIDSYFSCTNNKESVSLREGSDFYFYNTVFNGAAGVYLGESKPGIGPIASNFVFDNCNLTGNGYYSLREGGSNLLINGGSVTIDCTNAAKSLEPVPVIVDAGATKAIIQNLTRICINGNSTKPIVRNYAGANQVVQINNTSIQK